MQNTAYEMRISDWSSDVCSSDLSGRTARADDPVGSHRAHPSDADRRPSLGAGLRHHRSNQGLIFSWRSVARKTGRRTMAADRKSDGKGKSVSVRVDLGGGRNMKKNNENETSNYIE